MPIVVGFVPTKEGRSALRRATEEAVLRGEKLVVISSNRGGADFSGEDAYRFDQELERVEAELTTKRVDHEIRGLVRGKDPSEDLVAVADEVGAKLIVIGLRRRSSVGKLLMGSNAQRILLDANCDVLAVKADI